MPDGKKKVNCKDECNASGHPILSIKKPGFKSHMGTESNPTIGPKATPVVQPKYEEKVGYQAGTAIAGEPMQEKAEESGTGMSKAERDAKAKGYKTRY